MLYIVLAVLAGVCIVISRILNFNLANQIGVFQGTFFNYLVGLVLSSVVFIYNSDRLDLGRISFSAIPWWAFCGGLVGVAVVLLSTYLTPKTSAFYLTIFVFVGQLLIAGIIDYFTKGEISVGKIVGGLMVLAGLTYNLILDRNTPRSIDSSAS